MGKAPPRGDRLEGVQLGAYEIVRRVGSGSTASVYEAKHRALGKRVAIKLLHEHLTDDEQVVGRFLREGRVAARLRHPNIVDVLDVGSEDGVPYLVMAYLAGSNLRALLAETRVISVEHALDYLLPIASALIHAHDAGVIHRDLKPANILLAENERGDITPTLVDFGLSKAANAETDLTAALTSTELVAGTVLYMAPEQTFGVKNASAASDQYSLGALLYEAVTGEPPFSGDGVYVLIDQIRTAAIKPPSLIHGAVPPAFDDVVLRALNRKPDKRWADVRAFARALLPFASEPTARAVERDVGDRPSGSPRTVSRAASRPGLRVAPARGALLDLETRVPPLPAPPGKSPFNTKGTTYRGLVHHAGKVFPRGLETLCGALNDPALSEFLRQPFLASGRYDLLPILPVTSAFARLVGMPYLDFLRKATIAQAEYDARTIFRNVVSVAPVEEAAERLARLGTRFYDFVEFTGTLPTSERLALHHTGVPAYVLPWFEPMIVVYAGTFLRLLAGREVTSATYTVTGREKRSGFPVVSGVIDVTWAKA